MLQRELNVSVLLPYLNKYHMLTTNLHDELTLPTTINAAKVNRLMSKLPKMRGDYLECLIKCLRESVKEEPATSHDKIANVLEEELEHQNTSGMPFYHKWWAVCVLTVSAMTKYTISSDICHLCKSMCSYVFCCRGNSDFIASHFVDLKHASLHTSSTVVVLTTSTGNVLKFGCDLCMHWNDNRCSFLPFRLSDIDCMNIRSLA